MRSDNRLDEKTYLNLRATTANIPRFYALLKTHKENIPIRPIVSFIDSPTYNLAKFLAKTLKEITHKSQYILKNSHTAKDFLANIVIPENHTLVSFDVKNLFTCIPHTYVLLSVEKALDKQENQSIFLNTALKKADILNLVKLCLSSTTFQWNQQFYNQIIGTPMGSPISVALAELSMQHFEDTVVTNSPYPV